MSGNSRKFSKAANQIAFDENHRKTIQFNISRYDAAVSKGMARYLNVEKAKNTAAAAKRDVLKNWEKYLLQFEDQITKNGADVFWAENTAEAVGYIENIIKNNNAGLLVKSKSMTTEEIELNHIATSLGCESVETDLGEFIVQVAGEKPYHIVTPAMHKSKGDIAKLFTEKFNTSTSRRVSVANRSAKLP